MSVESDQAGDRWRDVRETVLERDGYECRFCGITNEEHLEEHDRGLEAHHVIPESDGGADKPHNLLTVCISCHRTLEETHGKAVSQMARREDYSETLAGVARVWKNRQGQVDEFNDRLAEFADGHPVFAEKFTVVDDGHTIEAHDLIGATGSATNPQVGSEWDFAVAWGYKEGVLDVVSALDGWTNTEPDKLLEEVEGSNHA